LRSNPETQTPMKNTIITKEIALLTIVAFCVTLLPEQIFAQCNYTKKHNPVANSSDCSCTYAHCSPSVVVVGHGGYNSCENTTKGYNSCLTPDPNAPPYDYYDTTLCQNEDDLGDLAECILAIIAVSGVDLSACGPALIPTGGALCYAAIAATGTAALACAPCRLQPCKAPSSSTTQHPVTPNGADTNSGSCPG